MIAPDRRPRLMAWLKAACSALALVGLLGATGMDLARWLTLQRGVASGLSAQGPPVEHPRFAANVNLERYLLREELAWQLDSMRAAGLGTVRQRFAWQELEPQRGVWDWAWCDLVIPATHAAGLRIIAVLDTSPAWARAPWEQDNPSAPPASYADYACFCAAFAQRYGAYIDAYQVWDEPNIAPHWGQGEIDPSGYAALLRAASAAIRAHDATCQILTAGLAPNLETGGRNMSELRFLQALYRLGAADAFDIVALKAYGFWSGPDDRRVADDRLNWSRAILLRREMERHGDGHKSLWAVDGGWCGLPSDWAGRPSAQGADTPTVQADRLNRATARIRQEWPWLGLSTVGWWQPVAAADDPLWGYALHSAEGEPTPLLNGIAATFIEDTVRYPGRYTWATLQPGAIARPNAVAITFWGTQAALTLHNAEDLERLVVRVDRQRHEVRLDAQSEELQQITLARGLPLGPHTLVIDNASALGGRIASLIVGARQRASALALQWITTLVLAAYLARVCLRSLAAANWRAVWAHARGSWLRLPPALQFLAVGGGLLLMALAPWLPVRLGGLALMALGAAFRPDLALMVAVLAIPWAPLRVRLGPGAFGPPEVAVLIAAAALIWSWLATPPDQRVHRRLRLCLLDWAVLALSLVAIASCFWAEYQHEALRELRVTVLEPALLYLLLRSAPPRQRDFPPLVDLLMLTGGAVALAALATYPTDSGVIVAEGVRRARAFYGSPNNLALVLERVLPLGLAMVLWSCDKLRRGLYGLGALLCAMALGLTFSRGALLIGLPVGVGALLWLKGGRARWALLALVLLGLALLFPLLRTERFASLTNPTAGTTLLRLSLWQSSFAMLRNHPLLGVGLDNFLYYYPDYVRPEALVDRWLSHPHNVVLDFWLRLGLPGLATLAMLLAGLVRAMRRTRLAAWKPDQQAAFWGLSVGLLAGLAHGLIDASFFVPELAYWFLASAALLANGCMPRPDDPANAMRLLTIRDS